ncbi:hypothetical protein PsorP6_006627 [Peronosclerospora sorghi]|uniref:Uncharacterized protein n=1 Tax=Peronosclerospora sorghi TaxID=230839 RepID=A0ACC0W5J4_9STRA|nr:hypothetical protein PsorP6_006627 [Peronosclerospora sorghi]
MTAPEPVEFHVVAQDWPDELGQRTKCVKPLGKGVGGTVYLSLYLPTFKLVAVKEITIYEPHDRHLVKRELDALKTSRQLKAVNPSERHKPPLLPEFTPQYALCPYLVTFYGAFLKPVKGVVSVVTEFMDRGSVQDLLDANVNVSEAILRQRCVLLH